MTAAGLVIALGCACVPGLVGPGLVGPALAEAAEAAAPPALDLVEADPAEALIHARRLAAAGRDVEAQRRLERLVAAHPNAPEARLARRELARYYSGLADPPRPGDDIGLSEHDEPLAEPVTAAHAHAETGQKAAALLAETDIVASAQLGSDVGDRIFFSAGSADLGGRARVVIARQARWLAARRATRILVSGHADEPGSEEDNQVLAARRAEAVRIRLIEEGLPAEQIRAVSLGRRDRVAPCDDSLCAAQNRRAVTVVLRGALASPSVSRPTPSGDTGPAGSAIGSQRRSQPGW